MERTFRRISGAQRRFQQKKRITGTAKFVMISALSFLLVNLLYFKAEFLTTETFIAALFIAGPAVLISKIQKRS